MKKPKIIGLVVAWGAELWIKPAVEQALEYCDEVILSVSCFTENLKKFKDNTYNIAKTYKDIEIIQYTGTSTHVQIKYVVLNEMLKKTKNYDANNWIWILDVDEFYPERSFREIKEIIEEEEFDQIKMESKFFLIDMRHYLKSHHMRLFRIKKDKMNKFTPTQHWQGGRKVFTIPIENGMFHYSLLTNPYMRKAQWKTEYPNTIQLRKTKWLDKIYLNYDLKNEEYWINENLKMFGVKSPYFFNGCLPDKDGKFFNYEGKHPKFIEEVGLTKIKDFRKYYE